MAKKSQKIQQHTLLSPLAVTVLIGAAVGAVIGFISCLIYLSPSKYEFSLILQYMGDTLALWIGSGGIVGGLLGWLASYFFQNSKVKKA